MSSQSIEQLIEQRHQPPEWVGMRELANGTGSDHHGSRAHVRRADVVAFNCWPSSGMLRVAYEVKRSRSDFTRELANPDKHMWMEKYFHETWFACENGVARLDEIPETWGLVVRTKNGTMLRKQKAARRREPEDLPQSIWLSAIRNVHDSFRSLKTRTYQFEGREIGQAEIEAKVSDALDVEREGLQRAKDRAEAAQATARNAVGPLEELKRLTRGWGRLSNGEVITREDVREWFEAMKTKAYEDLRGDLKKAHESLGRILDAG